MQIQNRANEQKSDSSFTLIPNSIISALLQGCEFNPSLFYLGVSLLHTGDKSLTWDYAPKKPQNTLSTSSIMKQFQFLQITSSQNSVINISLPLAHHPSFTLLLLLITYYILRLLTENPFPFPMIHQIKDVFTVQIKRKGSKREIKKYIIQIVLLLLRLCIARITDSSTGGQNYILL